MSDNKDLYEVLGVSRDASGDEIKKAYKKMVKKHHPDLNPDSKTAEENMKQVNHAYDILSDPEKKARYDQFGDDGNNSGGFGGGFGGFEGGGFGDIFDMFFGGGGGGRRNQNAPRQGNDLRVDLRISFEEAARGVTKEIELNRTESCKDCGGSGAKNGTERKTCSHCGGSGQVRVNQQTPFGQFQTVKTCPHCGGRGSVVETPCPTCSGSGRVKKTRTIKVNVPPGVSTDSRLRMQNEGEGGINGGPSGDLYIYITVSPHEFFQRNGDDILCNVPITVVQAALGAEIEVETLDGKVKLTVPAGTQTGTSFRLRGRGFPKLRGYGKGDQHVRVNVQTPTNLTDEQKDLLRKFGELDKNSTGIKEAEQAAAKPKGFFNKKKK